MFKRDTDTVILLFSNTSQKEVQEKQIISGHTLFSHLHHSTLKEAQKTGLNVLVFNEHNQTGNSFGERFSNAIQQVFNKGYKHIITIGNDSPGLTQEHLIIAERNLKQYKNTIGPSFDGGVYLIAISKHQFQKEKFSALPWQTPKLYKALQLFLSSNHSKLQILEHLKDIDTKDDLYYFLENKKYYDAVLINIILSIVYNFIPDDFSALHLSNSYIKNQHNKGSPILV